MYDIIIVGSGPAGLTAAIYARREEKRVMVIEKDTFGGQITSSPRLENYPGFIELSGNELADRLIEQVISHGGEIELDTVTAIEGESGNYTVKGENKDYFAKAVIIATGATHRKLGVYGEERLIGAGISYCAVCDGAFYRGKTVAVIGGGNSALQDAVHLSDICEKVYIVQNLNHLTGEERLQRLLGTRANVEIITSSVVDKLVGNEHLRAIEIQNSENGERRSLTIDGMFVCIGQIPQNAPFSGVIKLDDYGYAVSGESCLPETDRQGIFVAGDCRTKRIRQVTTAVSDGAVAALAACEYLRAAEV